MSEDLKTVPNYLTTTRLIMTPLLWMFALLRLPVYLGVGLIIAGLTDILDGYVARKTNQTSSLGSAIDSLADNILIFSMVPWLLLLRSEIFTNHLVLSLVAISLGLASFLTGLIKFRRIANLHLYSAKIFGLAGHMFVIHALLWGGYNVVLFYLTISLFMLSSIEALILQLVRPKIDEHMKSIVHIYFVRQKT